MPQSGAAHLQMHSIVNCSKVFRMFLNLARALRALSLGIWLGGIVTVFIVASTVFAYYGNDHTTAGELVGLVLKKSMPFKIGFALLALLCEASVFFSPSPAAPKGWRRFVPNACLVLALLAMLAVVIFIQPQLEELRQQIGVFNEKTKGSPLRQQFSSLHGASMGLGLLEGLLVAAALITGLL
jgi:hypothetical protein